MNKKLWIGFIVVYIATVILDLIIHGVLLASVYQSEALKYLWRPDMNQKMWIFYLVYVFTSFFFVLIFSKWYKGNGIIEGIQYGVYTGFMMAVPMGYSMYAMFPFPYSFAYRLFVFGFLEYVILGILLALVFGKRSSQAA